MLLINADRIYLGPHTHTATLDLSICRTWCT